MRVQKNEQNSEWETYRLVEKLQLESEGIRAITRDTHKVSFVDSQPMIMGQACGMVKEVLPARVIVDRMIAEAVVILRQTSSLAKL